MKKINTITLLVLFTWFLPMNAQYSDNMESYIVGEPIQYQWWGQGNCTPGLGCNLISSNIVSRTGNKSGMVPGDGTTWVGLDLDNRVFGQMFFDMWLYVPVNKEAVMQVMDYFPVGEGVPVFGNIFFNEEGNNPGIGLIDDCPNAPIYFEFPHDQWFHLEFNFDLSMGIEIGIMSLKVDNELVIPYGTPLTNSQGVYPTVVGGMQFLSTSVNSEFYLDDVEFFSDVLGVLDFNKNNSIVYPNPVAEKLQLTSIYELDEISVYNAMGERLFMSNKTDEVDVSFLPSGIYFLEAWSGRQRVIKKFIKN